MQELIFTSSSRGLQVGKSGFCTVAVSESMSPGLIRMLESLSGYRHLFTPGTPEAAKNPIAYSYIKAKVGQDFRYVLSRVKDCGKDYSGRSNKIAHHLSLDSDIHTSAPTRTLLEKNFFIDQWDKPPEFLKPRALPGKFSKPAPCSVWQKVAGDAGWAGELIESCQAQKIVYLIVKPSTPVMGLIHQAISLLPANQQWQYTFCTFYRQMPPNVECQIRCVMAGSPEMELTRQSSNNVLIDLTKPLGKSLSAWAENARKGTLIEGQPPAIESFPATAAAPRRNRLPSAMPDLNRANKLPPGLAKDQQPEEELDVLEIEPTPWWKRLLVASLAFLLLGGIASVVVYPDMYRGLFSNNFFSFFSSQPQISRFASERPDNAPPPKKMVVENLAPSDLASGQASESNPESTAGEAPDAAASVATDPAVKTPNLNPVASERGARPSMEAAVTSKAVRRNLRQGKLTAPPLPRSMIPQTQAPNRSSSRRFAQERPQPNQSGQGGPSSPLAASNSNSGSDGRVATGAASSDQGNETSTPVEAPRETLISIASLESVSFSSTWELIESSPAAIEVITLRHPPQDDLTIGLTIRHTRQRNDLLPEITLQQSGPRGWGVEIANRAVGSFQLAKRENGTRLEFQCHLDDDGRVDALADDLEAVNQTVLVLEFADNLVTAFPLNTQFVRAHVNFDNRKRNSNVMFDEFEGALKMAVDDDELMLLYNVHDFKNPSGGPMAIPAGSQRKTASIPPRERSSAPTEDTVASLRIEFPLPLATTAFEEFSEDQEKRLAELNARIGLELFKTPKKPLRYAWRDFIVDAPGFAGITLGSWRFGNHPLTAVRRDYFKRKAALKSSGRDQPTGDDDSQTQLLELVKSEIDFLDSAYKKTPKTLRVDELMPNRIEHPIEIRAAELFTLVYIDLGDNGEPWTSAEMRQAYHGSPPTLIP